MLKLFGLDNNSQLPLVAVIDFSKVNERIDNEIKISSDYYSLMFKNYPNNIMKYGRKFIDFQDGSLVCMAPNQVIEIDSEVQVSEKVMGWGLFFHPDLIRATSLNDKMKEYSFFLTKPQKHFICLKRKGRFYMIAY